MDCSNTHFQQEYGEYIVVYDGDEQRLREYLKGDCLQIVDEQLGILTVEQRNIDLMQVIATMYYMVPKCYGLMDTSNLEASGILKAVQQPLWNLNGQGVLIGIVDTGIDYRNDLFRWQDGTTRIEKIWDQSIDAPNPPALTGYGREYTKEEINQALAQENPLNYVESTDEQGHGTFVAGIMAGGIDGDAFRGIAPEASLLVVKLKEAKEYLRDFYFVPEGNVYQENDIIMAVYYLVEQAKALNMPISIYLGVGSNSGDHMGRGALNQYLERLSFTRGVVISVPGGNEGNAMHHATTKGGDDVLHGAELAENYSIVELNVGEGEKGFVCELWGNVPDIYAMGIESPQGDVIDRILPLFQREQKLMFALEQTKVEVAYVLVEELSGLPLIFLRFTQPTTGIWKFRIYSSGQGSHVAKLWLPIKQFLLGDTFFLNPDIQDTLTDLGTGEGTICTTSYDGISGGIALNASRGYTEDMRIKPDLAAPGVAVEGPGATSTAGVHYTSKSGSSIAAAYSAGSAALFMQWANTNMYVRLNGNQIRQYFIRGASRSEDQQYPNPVWGWGKLNLYGVFEEFRNR